jgi:iron complex outermembrane receptor protein
MKDISIRFAHRLLATTGAIGMLAGLAMPASAQAQESEQAAEGGLETVVVTAERREQDLQDIPIAVTVLSEQDLQRRAVDDVTDLSAVAPSLSISTINRSTFVNIRGVGLAQTAPTTVPGVAFYIDGQLIPHEQFIRQSFYDFGSVEVLRGPQGTLTGQNSTGGAVYIRTPRPDFDSVSGYADVTVGNYSRFRGVAAINFPLSPNIALRLAGTHEEMDSFATNIGPSGSNPGAFNQDGARANLAIRSDDDRVRINLRGQYFDYESDHSALKKRNDLVTSDPFVIEEDGVSYLNQEGYRLSGEVRWEFIDGVELRTLASLEVGEVRDQVDGDRTATALPIPSGLPANSTNRNLYPGRISNSGSDFDTVIGEVNLLSTGSGPFQWVIGGFLFDEQIDVFVYRDNYHTVDFVASNSDIVTVAYNKSKSIFGQFNWFATDQIELLAGARYSWDEQRYARQVLTGVTLTPLNSESIQSSSDLTGKLGVNFHLNDDAMLYLSASKGYKAGGVNLLPGTPNFQPEANDVYEGGYKLLFADNRVRLNGAMFYSDYKNIQFGSLQGGLPIQQNAASGEIYGGEVELSAQLGGFALNGGVSYLHAEFAENVCLNNANDPAATGGCPTGNQLVLKGVRLPFAPEWTINLGAEYEIELGNNLALTPRLQWSHASSQETTPFPRPDTTLDSRNIVDARLSLGIGDRYEVELYGTNIFDELYYAAQVGNSTSATGGYLYGAPAQYGVRGVVRF